MRGTLGERPRGCETMIQDAVRRKWLALMLATPWIACAAPVAAELSLVAGKPEGGVRTIRLAQDDKLTLNVRSDRAVEVHLHGYDVSLEVKAGAAASVTLTAHIVGRFPVAAHVRKGHEAALLYIEVHPR